MATVWRPLSLSDPSCTAIQMYEFRRARQLCDHEKLPIWYLAKGGHPAESKKVVFHRSLKTSKSSTETKVKLWYNLLVIQKEWNNQEVLDSLEKTLVKGQLAEGHVYKNHLSNLIITLKRSITWRRSTGWSVSMNNSEWRLVPEWDKITISNKAGFTSS